MAGKNERKNAAQITRERNEKLKQSAAGELARAARTQHGREQVEDTVAKIAGRRPARPKRDRNGY
jgi:hypothetical protein